MSEEQHIHKLLDCLSTARMSFHDAVCQIREIEYLKRIDISADRTRLIFDSFGEDIVGIGSTHISKRNLSINAGICLNNALHYLNSGLSDVRTLIWHILNDPVPESLETWASSKRLRSMSSSILTRAVFMDDEVRKMYIDHTTSPDTARYRINEDTSWENSCIFNIGELSSLYYEDDRLPEVVRKDMEWFVASIQTSIPLVDSCVDRMIERINSICDDLPGVFSDQDETSPDLSGAFYDQDGISLDLLDRIDEVSLGKFLGNLDRFAMDLTSIYAVKNSFQYFLKHKTARG